MKVKLKIGRVESTANGFVSYKPGDAIDVGDDEAKRLIDAGYAEAAKAAPKPKVAKKATKKAAPKKAE